MTLTAPDNDTTDKSAACVPARSTLYSPRQMTWLMLQRAESDRLTMEERTDLAAIFEAIPSLWELVELVASFVGLIRRRDVLALEGWIVRANGCAFGALKRFASGLCHDLAAVRASLEHEWSNGAVEGQVNRLKLVKRSITRKRVPGQGSFALLKARVLHRPAA